MGFAAPEGAPAETGAEVRLPEPGPAWRAGYSATAPGRIGPDKPPVSCHEPWFGCHEPIKAAARQRQGAQGRRSVAAAAAADRADGGGQYHGMCVAKDAVAKSACLCSARPRVFALRVCVGSVCERDSPAPVCRASACLSACRVSCPCCELLAVRAQEPWRVCRLGDVTYTRFAQLGLRLRGSR